MKINLQLFLELTKNSIDFEKIIIALWKQFESSKELIELIRLHNQIIKIVKGKAAPG